MKRVMLLTIFSLFTIPLISFAYTSPGQPQGFVSDFAQVITSSDISRIDALAQNIQDTTGSQIAVATIPNLGTETIETYANKLFQEWGVGQVGKNNGILVLVAPTEHKVRIEVGYGLEGTVTDIQSAHIIDDIMIPQFKNGNYGEGIYEGVDMVGKLIEGDPTVASQLSVSHTSLPISREDGNFYTALFFVGFWSIGILYRIFARTTSWWLGGVVGVIAGVIIGYVYQSWEKGILWALILAIVGLIIDYFASKNPPGNNGNGFWAIFFPGSGRGGFGGGGGFGGFGGGRSGGGGASGGW